MDGAHSVPENIVKCGEKKRGKGEGGSMQWPRGVGATCQANPSAAFKYALGTHSLGVNELRILFHKAHAG